MGWNTLDAIAPHPVLAGIPLGPDGLHAYFVHSYHLVPSRPGRPHWPPPTMAGRSPRSVGRDNMVGTQFHPEKSQRLGLALIANFLLGGSHDPVPRHRPEGRPVRAPGAGRDGAATVFNADPAAQARAFEAQGFAWLHVVDLNGAFAGKPVNGAAVDASSRRPAFRCSSAAASATWRHRCGWLDKGVARVILGTAAVRDPARARGLPRFSPAGSPSASTRAAARSRSRAGPRPPR
jgi:hypothetical protein